MKTSTGKNYKYEDGEWWYYNSKGVRTRCKIRVCEECQEEFPSCPYHPNAKRCSRQCRAQQGCQVDGCTGRHYGRGYCEMHHGRLRRHGGLEALKAPPSKEPRIQDGYVLTYEPGHPHAHSGRVLEHVRIMTEYLNRPLIQGETVHHINGVRDDNRLSNLELWSKSHPAGQRVEDKVAWAKELLALYEPTALNIMNMNPSNLAAS